jgi:hypothetical protein
METERVGFIIYAVRSFVDFLVAPFDLFIREVGLTAVGVLTGTFMLWVTRTWRHDVARTGHLGQKIRLLPGLLVASMLLFLLHRQLELRHGTAPLAVGQPVVIELRLDETARKQNVEAFPLENEEGEVVVAITGEPIPAEDASTVLVRAEIRERGTHRLDLRVGSRGVTKELSADGRNPKVSPERRRGLAMLWAATDELPLKDDDPLEAIRVSHRQRPQVWLGLAMPFELYWLLVAALAALLLYRPLRAVLQRSR